MEGLNIIYHRSEDFIYRKIVDETVLVPLRQNVNEMDSIYAMNEVASFIWETLEKPATLQELQQALLTAYDTSPEKVAEDLERFLNELVSIGAIKAV